MDTTQIIRQAFPIGYESLQRGFTAPTKPAPTSFSEGVFVVLPEGSSEHLYGPCKWGAIHGTAKPQPGAACVVGFDEQNQPTVLWWEGAQPATPVVNKGSTADQINTALKGLGLFGGT